MKYASIKGEEEVWKRPEHKEIAQRVAQESVVLLKNANNLLPLDRSTLKSIAVIGPRRTWWPSIGIAALRAI